MFNKALTVFLLIFFTLAVAWSLGARVHPDALGKAAPEEYLEITFKTGGTMVGKKTYEDSKGIHLQVEGGNAVFDPAEIKSTRPLSYDELPPTEKQIFQKGSFFTWNREDSIFYQKPEPKPQHYSPGHSMYEPQPQQQQSLIPGLLMNQEQGGMEGALNQVNSYAARRRQMDMERMQMMQEIEGEDSYVPASGGGSSGSSTGYSEDDGGGSSSSSSSSSVDSSINTGFEFNLKNS